MKLSTLILLAATGAEAGVLHSRQFGGLFGNLFGGLKVASVEKLVAEVKRPDAIRVVQRLGPITLRGVCYYHLKVFTVY